MEERSSDNPKIPDFRQLHVQRSPTGSPEGEVDAERSQMVELTGFEPVASSMPWKRATNCAIAP